VAIIKKKQQQRVNHSLSIIGIDTKIEGNIFTDNDFRVDGYFKGKLYTTGKVILSETSRVFGEVKATRISVKGKAIGDFVAKDGFTLYHTGEFTGSILTSTLHVMESAVFNAKCIMVEQDKITIDSLSKKPESNNKVVRKEALQKEIEKNPEGLKPPEAQPKNAKVNGNKNGAPVNGQAVNNKSSIKEDQDLEKAFEKEKRRQQEKQLSFIQDKIFKLK
jgi:cytoskeletal protein CcmA (bactofilin family)